jgi:hypothetical protein
MLAHGGQQSPRRSMSALLPKADIGTERRNVRFVPKADMNLAARGGRGLSEPTSHKKLASIYRRAIFPIHPIHRVALQISTDGDPNCWKEEWFADLGK